MGRKKSYNKKSADPSFRRRKVSKINKKASKQKTTTNKPQTNPKDVGFGDLVKSKKKKKDNLLDLWGLQGKRELDAKPEPITEQLRRGVNKYNDRLKSKLPNRKTISVLIGVFVIFSLVFWVNNRNKSSVESTLGINSDNSEEIQLPSNSASFDALEPNTDEAKQTDSYDPDSGIATFRDSLYNGDIIISQQEIPEQIVNDSSFEDFASSLPGIVKLTKVESNNKGVVYIADYESDAQTVLFKTESALIFINSEQSYKNEDWVTYVDSLN